ncbi:MAG: CAP domain-containing protein [bacterium]|nr:CAP domain-containing protein [bacterium]
MPLPEPLAITPPEPPAVRVRKASGPSFEDQVMEIVNQERWSNGELPPLKRDDLLDAAAEGHSSNMGSRNFFAHCDPDTSPVTWPGDRMVAAGYYPAYYGENIAAGYSSPSSVMSAWMASPGHRAAILSTGFWELGIGYVYDAADTANVRDFDAYCNLESSNHGPFRNYWTADFGRRVLVVPVVIDREAYAPATRDVDLYLYGIGCAVEMRIRNGDGAWTDWQPFSSDVAWQLSPGNGVKEVLVEISNCGTTSPAGDTIVLNQPDEIFADGFESGGSSVWSSTTGGP